jgi:hypothetical protein
VGTDACGARASIRPRCAPWSKGNAPWAAGALAARAAALAGEGVTARAVVKVGVAWEEIVRSRPADVYLDHQRLSWALAEQRGNIRCRTAADIVLVHHQRRAPHVAEALLGGRDVVVLDVVVLKEALALPARTPPEPLHLPPSPTAGPSRESRALSAGTRTSRSREIWGWLGLTAGVAVLVTALAVPLNDSGLALAAALVLRGGRMILDVDS